MDLIKTKVKKWGNSFGIILPIDLINKEKIKEGSEVSITVETNDRINVEYLFALAKKAKLKKIDVKKTLDMIDKEFED